MTLREKIRKSCPPLVRHILMDYEAWLVGSSVLDPEGENDWDVIVHPVNWRACSRVLLSCNPTVNSLGGLKIQVDGKSIDVWPSDINSFLSTLPFTELHRVHLFSLRRGFLVLSGDVVR